MRLKDIDVSKYDTIILDRDGTINVHLIGDYVRKWEDFKFIPEIKEYIALWTSLVKHIFVVTNQRGISKKLFTEADLNDVHEKMLEQINEAGGRIERIYYCTSLDDNDYRRKPNTGMFDEITHDFPDIIPSKTLMIGDSDVDEQFAKNCGINFIRINSLKREGSNEYWVNTI